MNSADPSTEERDQELPFPIEELSWRDILKRLSPTLRPFRGTLIACGLLIGIVALAVSYVPLYPKYVVDVAVDGGSVRTLFIYTGIFLTAMAVRILFWFYGQRRLIDIRNRILFQLRVDGFRHAQALSLKFHNLVSPGFLYEQIFGRSMVMIATFFMTLINGVLIGVVALVFSLGFCVSLSLPMTLILLTGTGVYITVGRKMSRSIDKRSSRMALTHNFVTQFIMDRLRGTKTIRAFSMEDLVQHEFTERVWDLHMKSQKAEEEMMRFNLITEWIGYMLTAAVIVTGGLFLMWGKIAEGTFIAFLGYQGTLIGLVSQIANSIGQMTSARIAFREYFSLMATPSGLTDHPDVLLPDTLQGDIRFEKVTFGYQPDQPVLKDLDLHFRAGETVALVGRSGSGKTTLTNLLMRFYDPDQGIIRVDGIDIRSCSLRHYRSRFGVVLQDPYLFGDTIANNLLCANPEATEASMIEALKNAEAWDFVKKLPQGIHSPLGESGNTLSGGQRQRLAIARCLISRSDLIVLDEPTSALDNESEIRVKHALEALCHTCTTIIIAHRLSTIRNADRIIVMDQGKVAEDGTYQELLQARGLFYKFHLIATSSSTVDIKLDEAGFA